MAKKQAYFWKGKGELKIDRLYVTGEPIPHEKMDKGTFDLLLREGDIGQTDFDVIENSTQVSKLQKQVKELSEQLVIKNADTKEIEGPLNETIQGLERVVADNGTKITELEAQAKLDAAEIVDLKAQVELLTEPKE